MIVRKLLRTNDEISHLVFEDDEPVLFHSGLISMTRSIRGRDLLDDIQYKLKKKRAVSENNKS